MTDTHRSTAETNLNAPLPSSVRQSLQGLQVSRYEILEPIGCGGMGEVYKARDRQLDRAVAVKAMRPDKGLSPEAAKRLEREARFAASLDHPFICKVHELIELPSGETLLVMEFVDGKTLKDLLNDGALTCARAIRICGEIAEAMGFAHASGLIHRDLKPANVMVTSTGHAKVMDFGIARLHQAPDSTVTDLTGGRIVGTPAYMSPEQAAGRPLDQRSDIYSFGLLLYESVTTKVPSDDAALRWQPTIAAGVPPDLRAIIDRCLERRVDARFESFEAVGVGLERIAARLTPTAAPVPFWRRPRVLWEVGTLIVLIAAGVSYATWLRVRSETALVMLTQQPLVSWATAERGSRVSPDGTTVSFISSQNGQQRIWMRSVKSATGSEPRALTEPTAEIRTPTWSDDGKRIAYLYRNGDRPWLRVVSVFGESAGQDRLIDAPWRDVALIRWIGHHIYFSRADGHGLGRLWRYDTDASRADEITHADGVLFRMSGDVADVDVRSDERQLISSGGAYGLAVSDLDGRNVRSFGRQLRRTLAPRWRGDGRNIVYLSDENGQLDVWECDVVTGTRSALTTSPLEETSLDVSASGEVIVADTVDDRSHLWSVDIARPQTQRQLTSDGRSDLGPTATDSGEVIFQRNKGAFGEFSPFDTDLIPGRWSGAEFQTGSVLDSGFGAVIAPLGGRMLYIRQSGPVSSLWVRSTGVPSVGAKVWDRLLQTSYSTGTGSLATRNVVWSRTTPNKFFFAGQSAAGAPFAVMGADLHDDFTSTVIALATAQTAEDRYVDLSPTIDDNTIAFLRTRRGVYQGGRVEIITAGQRDSVELLSEPVGVQLRVLGWQDDRTLVLASMKRGGPSEISTINRNGRRTRVTQVPGADDATFYLDRKAGRILVATGTGGRSQIVSVALSNGRITVLVSATQEGISYGGFALSANNKLLYVVNAQALDVWTYFLGPAKQNKER